MVFKYYALSLGVFGALMLAGCSGMEQEGTKNFSCPIADTSKLLGTPTALQERMQTPEFWDYASRHASNLQLSELIRYANDPMYSVPEKYVTNAENSLKLRVSNKCPDVSPSNKI